MEYPDSSRKFLILSTKESFSFWLPFVKLFKETDKFCISLLYSTPASNAPVNLLLISPIAPITPVAKMFPKKTSLKWLCVRSNKPLRLLS